MSLATERGPSQNDAMSLAAHNSPGPVLIPSLPSAPGSGLAADASMADLWALLGHVPLERIRLDPPPGKATEDDLLRTELEGVWELTDGTLVQKAVGQYESELACWIIARLHEFLATHRLGKVFGPDGHVRLKPGKVRAADVAFVRFDRFPQGPRSRVAFLQIAPNLAIEVLSPSNTAKEMEKKRVEYFGAGVEQVWEIDPETRTGRIYRSLIDFQDFPADGSLEAPSILPGFRLLFSELFAAADDMGP